MNTVDGSRPSVPSPPIPIEFADDGEGLFFEDDPMDQEEEEAEEGGEAMNLAASAIFNFEEDDEGEPIGWINGQPENEPLAVDEGEQQMEEEEDAEAPEFHEDKDGFIPAKIVTDDGPVLEWTDPLAHYIAEGETMAGGTRGKRRMAAAEQVQRFHCYYCKAPIETEPLYCPHPDSSMQLPIPDLEYPFCHPTCAKGWVTWEVGEPLASRICPLIDKRVGYVSDVAPAPYELLINQMGGLKVREDFITGHGGGGGGTDRGDARRAKNKDGKTGPQELD